MPWWGWIAVGALVLSAELAFVDAAFYLVFIGLSALLVGALVLGGVALPFWGQWLLFAGLAVGSLVLFRERVYGRMRPPPESEIAEGVAGATAVAEAAIAPGAQGAVLLRGSRWSARNDGDVSIEAGARCRVERADGLVLRVRLGD